MSLFGKFMTGVFGGDATGAPTSPTTSPATSTGGTPTPGAPGAPAEPQSTSRRILDAILINGMGGQRPQPARPSAAPSPAASATGQPAAPARSPDADPNVVSLQDYFARLMPGVDLSQFGGRN